MSALTAWLKTHPKAKAFVAATAQRVVRSFAASLLSLIVVGQGLTDVAWAMTLSVAGGAALVTLLLCISGQVATGNGPSFGSTETVDP